MQTIIIGIVHNWPGIKNSELDLVIRMRNYFVSQNYQAFIVDCYGRVLNEVGDITPNDRRTINPDLAINLHYLNPSVIGKISYVTNWNPMGYILDHPVTKDPVPVEHMAFITDCLKSHDRYLSASSQLMDQYAEAVRRNVHSKWIAQNASTLYLHTTTNHSEHTINESLTGDNFSVFYIGANWEKLSSPEKENVRHNGLFETLDRSGHFKFYGVKEQFGVQLWEGIDNYYGELPFDGGVSIRNKTIECGVSLVLSSEQHRKSAVVSTRIFQACQVGSVIISDRNPFIERFFGDNVLYFDYGESASETAASILKQIQYIKGNWQEAKSKGLRCKAIFDEKFAIEKELHAIAEQAKADLRNMDNCIEQIREATVQLIVNLYTPLVDSLSLHLRDLENQWHQNWILDVFAPKSMGKDISDLMENYACRDRVNVHLASAPLKLGECFSYIDLGASQYTQVLSAGIRLRPDHLSRMISGIDAKQKIVKSKHFVDNPAPVYEKTAEAILDTTNFLKHALNTNQQLLKSKQNKVLRPGEEPVCLFLFSNELLEDAFALGVYPLLDLALVTVLAWENQDKLHVIERITCENSHPVPKHENYPYEARELDYCEYRLSQKTDSFKLRDVSVLTSIGAEVFQSGPLCSYIKKMNDINDPNSTYDLEKRVNFLVQYECDAVIKNRIRRGREVVIKRLNDKT